MHSYTSSIRKSKRQIPGGFQDADLMLVQGPLETVPPLHACSWSERQAASNHALVRININDVYHMQLGCWGLFIGPQRCSASTSTRMRAIHRCQTVRHCRISRMLENAMFTSFYASEADFGERVGRSGRANPLWALTAWLGG